MSDIGNLREFLFDKLIFSYGGEFEGFEEFSTNELKELRLLVTMALVKSLCAEHGEVMKNLFEEKP